VDAPGFEPNSAQTSFKNSHCGLDRCNIVDEEGGVEIAPHIPSDEKDGVKKRKIDWSGVVARDLNPNFVVMFAL
jgi:hypothetical protein